MSHDSDVFFENSLKAAVHELSKAPNLVIQGPALSGLSTLLNQLGKVLFEKSRFKKIQQVNFSERSSLEQAIGKIALSLDNSSAQDMEGIQKYLQQESCLLMIDDFDLIEDNQKLLNSLCQSPRAGALIITGHGSIHTNVRISANTRFLTHEGLSETEAYILARKLLDEPGFDKKTSKAVWQEAQASPFLIRACYNSLSALAEDRHTQAIALAKRFKEEIYQNALNQLAENTKQKLFYFTSIQFSQVLREKAKGDFSVLERKILSDLGLANESFGRFFIRSGLLEFLVETHQEKIENVDNAKLRLEALNALEIGPNEAAEKIACFEALEQTNKALACLDKWAGILFEQGHSKILLNYYQKYKMNLSPKCLGTIVRLLWFSGEVDEAIEVGKAVGKNPEIPLKERAGALFNLGMAYLGKIEKKGASDCYKTLMMSRELDEKIQLKAEIAYLSISFAFYNQKEVESVKSEIPKLRQHLEQLSERDSSLEFFLYGSESVLASRSCQPQRAYDSSLQRLNSNLPVLAREWLVAECMHLMYVQDAGKELETNLDERIQSVIEKADLYLVTETKKIAECALHRHRFRLGNPQKASKALFELLEKRKNREPMSDEVEDIAWVMLPLCALEDSQKLNDLMQWPLFQKIKDSDYLPQKALLYLREFILKGVVPQLENGNNIAQAYFYSWALEFCRPKEFASLHFNALIKIIERLEMHRMPQDVLAYLLVNATELATYQEDEESKNFLYEKILENISLKQYPLVQKRLLEIEQKWAKYKRKQININQVISIFEPVGQKTIPVRSKNRLPWQKFDFIVDESAGSIFSQKYEISYKRKPLLFKLFCILTRQGRTPLSREMLVKRLWDEEYNPLVHDARIYSAIADLRRSFAKGFKKTEVIDQMGGIYSLHEKICVGFLCKKSADDQIIPRSKSS